MEFAFLLVERGNLCDGIRNHPFNYCLDTPFSTIDMLQFKNTCRVQYRSFRQMKSIDKVDVERLFSRDVFDSRLNIVY